MKRVIRDLPKNSRETLRIEFDEYQSRQLFSARVWFDDGSGTLRPTSKGVSLDIRHLPAMRDAIDEAERVARAEGLL